MSNFHGTSYLDYAMRVTLGKALRDHSREVDNFGEHVGMMVAAPRAALCIVNETNLTGGENVGGPAAAPAAPEVAADDDGDGDSDPEPEPRPLSPPSRQWRARAKSLSSPASPPEVAPSKRGASIPDALASFDLLPDAAHVRLPVVCGLFACSPATAWRRAKAGTIPAPVKLSERVTAWRVGDLRTALAEFRA